MPRQADDAQTLELKERLAGLEARLDRLGTKLGDLRQSFQDLAIAADERLASIEDEIAEARRELPAE
ncbi:MAG TPA: hypothetical protein VF129_09085 [Actinomycetota bacterium]